MKEYAHDIPYNYLYLFSVIASEGNLTRASERLYRTQPSLSVAMKKLEASLGFPLFEHHSNRLVLNEAGKCLLEYVNSGLSYFEDGMREARKTADRGEGLRIVTSMGIVRPLAEKYEQTTGVKVEVDSCDTEKVLSRICSGKADIGVNFGIVQDSRISSRTLVRGPYCLAVNETHPLSQRQSVSVRELEPYQLFCSHLAHTKDKIQEMFKRAGCTPKLLELDEKDVLFRAAELGLGGVVCLPMMSTRRKDGAPVRFIPITGTETMAASVILTKRGAYLGDETKGLMDYLIGEFAKNQNALNEMLSAHGLAPVFNSIGQE